MRVMLSPLARTKLERLCDAKWPAEVGGELLGKNVDGDVFVSDVFAVPNVSSSPFDQYLAYEESKYFLPLFLKMTGLDHVGSFHSHPNSTVPSEKDMRSCPGFHLWVVHQKMGYHTFIAAKNYVHVEVELLNEVASVQSCMFRGDRFFFGDLHVNEFGKVVGDATSLILLKLSEKTRVAYIAVLKCGNGDRTVELKKVSEYLGVSNKTLRSWLRPAKDLVELRRGFVRLKTQP